MYCLDSGTLYHTERNRLELTLSAAPSFLIIICSVISSTFESSVAFGWICAIVYSLGMIVSDQARAGTEPVCGRGTAEYAHEGGGLNSYKK